MGKASVTQTGSTADAVSAPKMECMFKAKKCEAVCNYEPENLQTLIEAVQQLKEVVITKNGDHPDLKGVINLTNGNIVQQAQTLKIIEQNIGSCLELCHLLSRQIAKFTLILGIIVLLGAAYGFFLA